MYSTLLFFCITISILFSGGASMPLQKRFNGEATFYDVGLGACGETNTPGQLIAAAGASRFDSEKPGICGRQVTITGPKGSVTVIVKDRCAGCGDNDWDLSTGAFNKIADPGQGRVPISWTFGGGGGGDSASGADTPPKAAAPTASESTSTSTTSTSTTSTSTSTTSTSTTPTPTPTPTPTDTPSVNDVAVAFFSGEIVSGLPDDTTIQP